MLQRTRDHQTGYQILQPGAVLENGWQINRLLGAGGFGSVYQATSPDGLQCALKEFRPHPQLPADALLERVEMEARVVRSFKNHPCLPDFIARFDFDDTHFLAEEFVEGATLSSLLRAGSGTYSLGESLAWLCVLTRTLDHLHRRLLLYQDLKPANILITHYRTPVLVDFGAARHYAGSESNPRMLFGSQGYIAPEILTDPAQQRDYRSDVYSLGCLCYTLLTGRILSQDQILGRAGVTLPSKAMLKWRPEAALLPEGWLHALDEMLVLALQTDPKDRLADLRWFFKKFQGLILAAGDTEQVDTLLRLVNDRIAEQDRLIDMAAEEDAEGDPENIRWEPETVVFAPLDVHAEVVAQPVSIWTTTGKPIRASISIAGIGIETVEKNLRVSQGRIRIRVFPRRVGGVDHWSKGTLIVRLHTHRVLRIPLQIFVARPGSPILSGKEPLPPFVDLEGLR